MTRSSRARIANARARPYDIEVISIFESETHPCEIEPPPPSGACFSADGRFRYNLWRSWGPGPAITFLMLNPSLADATKLDPTVNRCFNFARRLDYGTMFVANVFPLVSPYPKDLLARDDRDGEAGRNHEHIARNLASSTMLLLAFGSWPLRPELCAAIPPIRKLVDDSGLVAHALRRNADGSPGHPLYLPGSTNPVPYDWPA